MSNVRSLDDKRQEKNQDASAARIKQGVFLRKLRKEPDLIERIALCLAVEKREERAFLLKELGPTLQELLALGVAAQAMEKGGVDWRLAVQKMIPSFDLNEIVARADQIVADAHVEYERLTENGLLKRD